MTPTALPGGTFRLADDLEPTRVGYGAMQLAGPGVFGPPRDRDAAVAVLRTAVDLGITHVDTADFYGPVVTNELIREALAPYPEDLRIVTKVGATRDAQGGWPHARSPEQLRAQVHDNLRHLGVDVLDVVNLRVGGVEAPEPGSLAEPFEALAELQQQGLIKHLGVSTVTAEQLAQASSIAPVVCVQNLYNVARREDDALVDLTARRHRLRAVLPARRFLPRAVPRWTRSPSWTRWARNLTACTVSTRSRAASSSPSTSTSRTGCSPASASAGTSSSNPTTPSRRSTRP